MKAFFALFSIATLASLVTTPIIRRLCQRFGLLDIPADGRRLHRTAIPRLGGVALYLSCLLALSTLPIFDRALAQSLFGQQSELFAVFVSSTLVLFLGVYDDLKGTNAVLKFVGLGLITSLFYALGGRIDALSIPFVGSVQLPAVLSYLITVLWLVGIANAFNLIDGMDGLAS